MVEDIGRERKLEKEALWNTSSSRALLTENLRIIWKPMLACQDIAQTLVSALAPN
jgi:hypothetical protein